MCSAFVSLFQIVFISKCAQQVPLTFEDYTYPMWANWLGFCIVAFPVLVMLCVFLYTFFTGGGYQVRTHRVRYALTASSTHSQRRVCTHSVGYALTASGTHSQRRVRTHSVGYALTA